MSQILLSEVAAPSTPAAGKGSVFIDSQGMLCYKDDNGRIWAQSGNAAIASQGAGFATDTYVTNSDVLIPSFSLQAKTNILWKLSVSKTAAGIVAPNYVIRIGSARTTADSPRISLTGPAQTAVADIGVLNILMTVRTIGATGTAQATAWWDHRGTAASSTVGVGFANDGGGHVEAASIPIDTTALGGSYAGLSINGGTSAAWTITQVVAWANW